MTPSGRLDRVVGRLLVLRTGVDAKKLRILPIAHADNLPGSFAVHRLAGVGHMPHMEAVGEVNRLIGAALG